MWTELLHHATVLSEVWISEGESWSNHKTHFQSWGIEIVERNWKKFIKIDTSIFWQFLPVEFRKILENPSIRDLDELKNRLDDFWRTNSNSMEWVPARLAFSSFPLTYNGTDECILSLINSWWIQFEDILTDMNNFTIDLTFNSNPWAMFWELAAINAEIIEKPSEVFQVLMEKKINQIVWNLEHTTVINDNDIWVIVSDWTTEQIIPWYSYTFDKKVSAIEMWKTTVRKSWNLILEWLVDWKQERFNTSVNLWTLIDYFQYYYTTSNNTDWRIIEWINSSLKITPHGELLNIWELSMWGNLVKKTDDFKKITNKYLKTDRLRYNEYAKLLNKITFIDWWKIQMKADDLKLTPPVILWLEKLLKEGGKNDSDNWSIFLGNTMISDTAERDRIGHDFQVQMKQVLLLDWEDEIKWSKIKSNWKFGNYKSKTPDYIEENNWELFIFDFKAWNNTTEYNKFQDTENFSIKYNWVKRKNVTVNVISLLKTIADKNENVIYYKDFFKQKWINLSNKQLTSLNKIEEMYIFQDKAFKIKSDSKRDVRIIL